MLQKYVVIAEVRNYCISLDRPIALQSKDIIADTKHCIELYIRVCDNHLGIFFQQSRILKTGIMQEKKAYFYPCF